MAGGAAGNQRAALIDERRVGHPIEQGADRYSGETVGIYDSNARRGGGGTLGRQIFFGAMEYLQRYDDLLRHALSPRARAGSAGGPPNPLQAVSRSKRTVVTLTDTRQLL